MKTLTFSNGVTIDSAQIISIDSNQQSIPFPGEIGELQHMLQGQPSILTIRLRDGSEVEIKAGHTKLGIRTDEP